MTASTRAEDLAAVETQTLNDLISKPADLGAFAEVCPPPCHRWFERREFRIAALALDAALAGRCQSDSSSMTTWLSLMSFNDAMAIIKGERTKPAAESCEYEDSALAAIGGLSAWGSWPFPSAKRSAAAGWWHILRAEGERRAARDVVAATLAELDRLGLGENPGTYVLSAAKRLEATASGAVGDLSIGGALASALVQAKIDDDDRRAGRSRAVSWGLPELDAACPMRPGGLYVLAARPGGGKTSLALQAAAATAKACGRGAVAVASLEMSGPELALILAASELGISPARVRSDWGSIGSLDQQALHDLSRTWDEAGAVVLREGPEQPTAEGIAAWARSRAPRGLALLVVDHLGLLEEPKGSRITMMPERFAERSRVLKLAAKDLRVPVLLLAQLNRDGRKATRDKVGSVLPDPEPRVEDLYGGSQIEANADAVILLHRLVHPVPGKLVPTDCIIAKNRHGPMGKTPLLFSGAGQRFTPRPTPTQAVDPERAKRWAASPSAAEEVFP